MYFDNDGKRRQGMFMNHLYKKNELIFAIWWIVIYVVGLSLADNMSVMIGTEKLVTAFLSVFLAAVLIVWMKKNQLFCRYGLCKSEIEAKRMLYYIPLVFMASINLWFGVTMNLSLLETCFYIISMLAVGFLEEIIFRGLLFQSMCNDNVKTAIIVSSVTFGIGHIVNLINGSGANLFSNLLQVGYAIAAGFLFTIIFYKTKSLLACIITHGVLNSLSVFANEATKTPAQEMISAIVLAGISIIYTLYILKMDEGKNELDNKEI